MNIAIQERPYVGLLSIRGDARRKRLHYVSQERPSQTCDRDSISSYYSSSADSRGKKDDSPYRKSRTRSPPRSPSRSPTTSPPPRTSHSRSRSRSKSIDKGHERRQRSKSLERHSERRRPSHRSPDYRHRSSRDDPRHRSHSRERRSRNYHRSSRRSSSKGRSRSRERRRRSRSHERWHDGSRRNQQYHRSDRRRSRSTDRQSRDRSHSRSRPVSFQRTPSSEQLEKVTVKPAEEPSELKISTETAVVEKTIGLPLNTLKPGVPMTPQMAVQQAMAAMNAKAQALTGISLPTYYNPAAVNPLKYAEQVQKRKLLWQNKEKTEQGAQASSAKVWENLTFSQDQDGKMTAKFRKLMGIKSEGTAEAPKPEEPVSPFKKQEELFRDLDHQYEVARMSTHTHRGVGLGYSSQPAAIFPPSK